MATEYKLTWRQDQGGRWTKKYRKRQYFFPPTTRRLKNKRDFLQALLRALAQEAGGD